MNDEMAPAFWSAKPKILGNVLKVPKPWATKDRLGHLRWNQLYMRGPTCIKDTFGQVLLCNASLILNKHHFLY